MLSLLVKEWREHRKVALAAAMIWVAGAATVPWMPDDFSADTLSRLTAIVLVVLGLVFVLGVSADLVANETGSGRAEFFAALPVRPGTRWLAKVTFLLGASLFFLVVVALVFGFAVSRDARAFPLLAWPLRWAGPILAGLAAAAGAGLLFSTLLDRGVAAVGAAIAVLGGIALVVGSRPGVAALFRSVATRTITAALAVLAVAFFFASFLAFTRGRIHLPAHVRRVLLAGGALALLLLPPAALADRALDRWMRLSPADADVVLEVRAVGPDSEWVVVAARRHGTRPGDGSPHALWALRTDGTGPVRTLPAGDVAFAGAARVEVRTPKDGSSLRANNLTVTAYDLETGRADGVRAVGTIRALAAEPPELEGTGLRIERSETGDRLLFRDRMLLPRKGGDR